LIASTPSATACSIAIVVSVDAQPAPVGVDQQALYMAMRARGTMPLMLPSSAPATVIGTPWLPAAVLDVCEP
jgi:hypothetical protein